MHSVLKALVMIGLAVIALAVLGQTQSGIASH